MKKFYLISIFFIIIFPAKASIKGEIIEKLKEINSLSFNFTQTVNGKDESGNCLILYPKKIYCKYKLRQNKILVSNGKSLVIKSDKNKQYYRYPLKSTMFNYLLDMDFLINENKTLDIKLIDAKYYLFSINKNNQIINIFFDKKTLNIVGWQTEDLYQNLSVTYIYDLGVNVLVDNKKFKLPEMY